MTVEELIEELKKMPKDAIVLGDPYLKQDCIIDTVEYDDETNTISFYGDDFFEEPDITNDDDDDFAYGMGYLTNSPSSI